MNPVCPLHRQASSPDQVEWAGLLINLDMAFSSRQRDKVYVQHLKRKQDSPLSRLARRGAAACACSAEGDRTHFDLGASA